MLRRSLVSCLGLLALAAPGCGARSGLDLEVTTFDAARPDAGPVDAPIDAPPGIDAPPECRTDFDCADGADCTIDSCVAGRCMHAPDDAACDDGLYCDGVERCDPRRGCVPGRPPRCNDGIDCTLDACDEALDACVSEPHTELCPISHRCDPVLDCVARALAHDERFLYEIDLPSGALRTLGVLPVPLTDLALHPDGTLYGAGAALYSVDYLAGTFATVAMVSGSFNSLDTAPDGTLYGAASSRIVRFDVATGAVTDVARFPAGLTASGDLAFVGGVLYATATTGSTARPDALVRVDIAARTTAIVGSINYPCVWGLAPFGDTLYGLTCNGLLLRIDVASGAGEVLATLRPRFYGAGAR